MVRPSGLPALCVRVLHDNAAAVVVVMRVDVRGGSPESDGCSEPDLVGNTVWDGLNTAPIADTQLPPSSLQFSHPTLSCPGRSRRKCSFPSRKTLPAHSSTLPEMTCPSRGHENGVGACLNTPLPECGPYLAAVVVIAAILADKRVVCEVVQSKTRIVGGHQYLHATQRQHVRALAVATMAGWRQRTHPTPALNTHG